VSLYSLDEEEKRKRERGGGRGERSQLPPFCSVLDGVDDFEDCVLTLDLLYLLQSVLDTSVSRISLVEEAGGGDSFRDTSKEGEGGGVLIFPPSFLWLRSCLGGPTCAVIALKCPNMLVDFPSRFHLSLLGRKRV